MHALTETQENRFSALYSLSRFIIDSDNCAYLLDLGCDVLATLLSEPDPSACEYVIDHTLEKAGKAAARMLATQRAIAPMDSDEWAQELLEILTEK